MIENDTFYLDLLNEKAGDKWLGKDALREIAASTSDGGIQLRQHGLMVPDEVGIDLDAQAGACGHFDPSSHNLQG